jgi:hypothetical protein
MPRGMVPRCVSAASMDVYGAVTVWLKQSRVLDFGLSVLDK